MESTKVLNPKGLEELTAQVTVTSPNPVSQSLTSTYPLLVQKYDKDSRKAPHAIGTQVNIDFVNQVNVSNLGQVSGLMVGRSDQDDPTESLQDDSKIDIPIKVVNPVKRRQSKTYMLNLSLRDMGNLQHLREEILEQLGKNIVSFCLNFDVGYCTGSHKICFTDSDNIREELLHLKSKGKSLWCAGLQDKGVEALVCLDSESEDETQPSKKSKMNNKEKVSSFMAKTCRVDALATTLNEKHKDKYNKIQCKLWAEAIDLGKHESHENPPLGPIWCSEKPKTGKKTNKSVECMASAFTHMANSVASAFSTPDKQRDAQTDISSSNTGVGISPGRRIDYQDKLFKQIDMLHKMYERGALTPEQFEKRCQSLLEQLDSLDFQ